MIAKLFWFLKKPTSKNVIINTIGNYLNVFFSAFFVYLLVRILNPSEYGVLSVLFGIMFVLANILDFGTSATIYSYLPVLFEKDTDRAYRFMKSTFIFQTFFATIVIMLLIITFPFLDTVFFKTGAPISTLYVTAIAVMFFIWQNFLSNCLYVAKRVLQVNLYTLYANIIKTALIGLLAITGIISVGLIIFIIGIVGPVIFYLFVYSSKKDHLSAVWAAPISKQDLRISYTFTYFVASQFFNLGQRMDLFLVSYFLSKETVGYYGLAQKIILTIITSVVSITQVLSPGFAQIKTQKGVFALLRSGFLYMLVPTAIFLLLAVTPDIVFDIILTNKFTQTAGISRLMGLVFIPFSFVSLFHLFLLYTAKKPLSILYANLVYFGVVTVGCYIFIPLYGVPAALTSIAVGLIAASIMLIFLSLKEYRRLPKD